MSALQASQSFPRLLQRLTNSKCSLRKSRSQLALLPFLKMAHQVWVFHITSMESKDDLSRLTQLISRWILTRIQVEPWSWLILVLPLESRFQLSVSTRWLHLALLISNTRLIRLQTQKVPFLRANALAVGHMWLVMPTCLMQRALLCSNHAALQHWYHLVIRHLIPLKTSSSTKSATAMQIKHLDIMLSRSMSLNPMSRHHQLQLLRRADSIDNLNVNLDIKLTYIAARVRQRHFIFFDLYLVVCK